MPVPRTLPGFRPLRSTARRPARPGTASLAPSLLLAVALLLAATACSSASETSASGGTETSTTSTAPTSTTEAPIVPATTDPPGTTRFNVYWLRDCPSADVATEVGSCRLVVGETRTTTDADILTASLRALDEGPNGSEAIAGFTSNIRPIAELGGVSVEDGVAVVDYNRYFETATTRPQVAQVVYTLTQFPSITGVRFLIDGAPNGATGTRPTGRIDVLELAPPVLVETPAAAGVVTPTFAVGGTLLAADVTFTTRVEGPDGAPLTEVPGAAISPPPSAPPPFLQRVSVPATTTGPVVLVVTASDGTETRVPVIVQAP